jgi:hypothetical protein
MKKAFVTAFLISLGLAAYASANDGIDCTSNLKNVSDTMVYLGNIAQRDLNAHRQSHELDSLRTQAELTSNLFLKTCVPKFTQPCQNLYDVFTKHAFIHGGTLEEASGMMSDESRAIILQSSNELQRKTDTFSKACFQTN